MRLPPDMSLWQGRDDTATEGSEALRIHQCIKPWSEESPPGVCLLGFACDEGVRRNQGRVGAAEGPAVLRRALANLSRPIWWDHSQSGGDFHDAGDIRCADGNLERAQEILGEVVAQLICGKQRVVTIGGGHETAWGSFLGVVAAFPDAKVGVINLDAHLDVRPGAIAHSGTPFRQMADWHRANGRLFQCLCLGLAEHSNTEAAITTADSLGVEFKWDHQVDGNGMHWVGGDLERFMQSVDFLYLSLDLDVLSGWIMPAVSAPAGSGVSLTAVDSVIRDVMSSDKVVAVDVVEFNPTYDRDGIAARVASRLIWYVMERWKKAPEANHP